METVADKLRGLLPRSKQGKGQLRLLPAVPLTENDDLFEPVKKQQDWGTDDNAEFPKNDPNQPQPQVIDQQLMQQPVYEDPGTQMANDVAADESLQVLNYYISQRSQLGDRAQARLMTRAAAFQSKNQVYSNITDIRDYQMAQDDFAYAQLLSKADFTCYDMNTDYFVAEAIMESQFNIRLRRSRKALNLLQLNTQRMESGPAGGYHQQEEKKGVMSKLSLLGGGGP